MATKEYLFSELIEEVSERNTNLKYGLDDIVGVTIEKGLIPTIANLTQTALDKFYIVKPDTFVYNPRTHGVRLGMGYNESERTYLTSWNNVAFKVKETAKKIVLSKYLWIYFNRSEWDRQTNFMAWGSSTIVFAWTDFLTIKIKLPDIKEQKRIVEQYTILQQRIDIKKKINKALYHYGQLIFKKNFINYNNNNKALLKELISFTKGKKPEDIQNNKINNYEPYLTIEALTTNKKQFASKTKTVTAEELDILMVMDGASSFEVFSSKKGIVGSTLAKINFITPTIKESIFQFLKYNKEEYQNRNADTAIPHADKDFILQQEITIPENLQELEKQFYTIRSSIYKNEEQILYLEELLEIIGNNIKN